MKAIFFALLPLFLYSAPPEDPPTYYLSSNAQTDDIVRALLPHIITLNYDVPLIQEMNLRAIITAQFKEAYRTREGIFIAEQSGLSLNALNGLPGPFYPWFQMQLGNVGIVNVAKAMGNDKAEIITVVGYAKSKDDFQFFEGRLEGRVVTARGFQGANWESIFVPEGQTKTLSEMDSLLKNALSSRRYAFDHLKGYLNLPEKPAE